MQFIFFLESHREIRRTKWASPLQFPLTHEGRWRSSGCPFSGDLALFARQIHFDKGHSYPKGTRPCGAFLTSKKDGLRHAGYHPSFLCYVSLFHPACRRYRIPLLLLCLRKIRDSSAFALPAGSSGFLCFYSARGKYRIPLLLPCPREV